MISVIKNFTIRLSRNLLLTSSHTAHIQINNDIYQCTNVELSFGMCFTKDQNENCALPGWWLR